MIHYFDNAATTPVRPEAVQAAVEAMTEGWGNPSSRYALGSQAAATVKQHRAQVAAGLGCKPEELFFTSCGTEGDNWAIQGAVELGRRTGKHIITTAYEHAAVLETCRALEREGYEVTYLQPDREGNLSLEELEGALRPDTVLVSMMLVNNELGTLLPVAEAAQAIRDAGSPALLHCDAVQAFLDGKTEDELSKEEAMTRALKRELKRLDQSLSTQWMALEGTRLDDYFAYGPEGGETP